MFKYTNALIWRTKTQIEKTIHIVNVVMLFSGVLIPLVMLIAGGGVWVRNLILFICGLGLATFALIQEITKHKASKEKSESIHFLAKIIRIIADVYALFLLCYGIFSVTKDPSVMTVLPLIPIALSLLWNLLMLLGKIIVDKVIELMWDAVELDTKPVYETIKKTEQLWHLIKKDGVVLETRIEVSEHNKEVLDKTLVKFKAAMAAKKTKQQLIKQQQQAVRVQARKTAFVRFVTLFNRKKVGDAPAIEVPETVAEIPTSAETSAPQIEVPKKKNPLAFLIGKKKKSAQQLAMSQEECTEEEAIPKA